MAIGPGVYDDICTQVREETNAKGVILLVLDGDRGAGVSAQLSAAITPLIPALLRELATAIETDIKIKS